VETGTIYVGWDGMGCVGIVKRIPYCDGASAKRNPGYGMGMWVMSVTNVTLY